MQRIQRTRRTILTVLLAFAATSLFACDKKPAKSPVESNSAAVEVETTEPAEEPEPEPEPELTPEQVEAREKSFGAFIEGADLVKVGRSHFAAGSDAPNRVGATSNPDVIASLIAAVGPEQKSIEPKSECTPTHYIVFFKDEKKLRSFKFWCEESDAIPAIYIEDRQFTPLDVKTAGKMVNGILDGTYADTANK